MNYHHPERPRTAGGRSAFLDFPNVALPSPTIIPKNSPLGDLFIWSMHVPTGPNNASSYTLTVTFEDIVWHLTHYILDPEGWLAERFDWKPWTAPAPGPPSSGPVLTLSDLGLG